MPSDSHGSYRINPAFDRFHNEGRIIGKLLAGFGEIEFSVCRNAERASRSVNVMKALYRLRNTSSRFDAADALARPGFQAAGLSEEYQIANGMVSICLKIRNQFAHCMWADAPGQPEFGLFFADLQASADASEGFEHTWRHVDVALLQQQETYFAVAMEWLWYLWMTVHTGGPKSRAWPKPPLPTPPPLHNPLEMHVPPWLNEDQKGLHVARALAAKGGDPTPTPAQQALDKAREAKRAKKQADRETSKRLRPDSRQ